MIAAGIPDLNSDIAAWVGVMAAYVIGATPFGFLAGKLKGIDIRNHGSGNIGATNVLRTLGKPIGIAVLVLDVLKGVVPVLIMQLADASSLPQIFVAIATILGHNYTFWLGFKGGKGIATSAGAIALLMPWPLLISVIIWAATFFISRYVSLASILAAVSIPISVVIVELLTNLELDKFDWPLLIFSALLAAMAIGRHQGNLKRLRAGTENRFQSKSKR